jgi:alkyl sulfatase BDS1-like metallo-beta-lactamase superfamily hydrolase
MKFTVPVLLTLLIAVPNAQQSFANDSDESSLSNASPTTVLANKAVAETFDLNNQNDFNNASRGLVATMPEGISDNNHGAVGWDTERFSFITGTAPDTVNPSLWRQGVLNNFSGLFKVTEGIWQMRGYDLANMTLVAGKTGWIVIDPLLTAERAKATFDFANKTLGERPIVAVIYTHSHIDHFGGVRGIVSDEDITSGRVKIIAPAGFMENAVAENVLAGNVMSRRASYQFGTQLPSSKKQSVGTGLGKALSTGSVGLIPPTDIITKTGEELSVDGIRIVFQMANGSEAPAEFAFYFPDYNALCLSEVVTANMHNVYTLRGAKMRDSLGWSKYINEMLDLFPDADIAFRSHHWPVWDKKNIKQHLSNQRDAYRYIHDVALNLANKGKKMGDLGNVTDFPAGLKDDFSTHGYYGTLSHNLRAVYNFYLGFYDGNPATLNALPPREASIKYVEAMGGVMKALKKTQQAYDQGDYRWAAELGNHVVFTDPENKTARFLQANILEQLGYQAESAVWRNEYLTAAMELREGVKIATQTTLGPDMVGAMSLDMMFDYLAVRLDRKAIEELTLGINITFTDLKVNYALELSNSVLNNTRGRLLENPQLTLSLTRKGFFALLLGQLSLPEMLEAKQATIEGDPAALAAILRNLETFKADFNIVTPAAGELDTTGPDNL